MLSPVLLPVTGKRFITAERRLIPASFWHLAHASEDSTHIMISLHQHAATRISVMIGLFLLGSMVSGCAVDDVARHLTGRDCNAGYIQQGEDWCAPPERPPAPQPYCTKSWNGVDCWSRPDLMPNVARQVAEGPTSLTQDQNANRLNLPLKQTPPTNAYLP